MRKLRLALTGVGGFGTVHAASAEVLAKDGLVELAAFCEPDTSAAAVERLRAAGLRHYASFSKMLERETALDAVTIATPIHCHCPMALAAFERGLHVFLEKPPAVRIQDLREMVAAQERAERFCAVGFHDMARPLVQLLKHRLCAGAIGQVKRICAETRWRRARSYYCRSPWAGKLRYDGAYVLDGPMNNSCAHTLNLAAYLAGDEPHTFAVPVRVQGELYRANAIEGEDTDCLRATMNNGVEICILLTQCATQNYPRSWTIEGAAGTARLHDTEGVTLPEEQIAPNGQDVERPTTSLMRQFVETVLGADEPLLMPLDQAESYVLMANGAYESAGGIRSIPEGHVEYVSEGESEAAQIRGIDAAILEACAAGRLLSETDVPWAAGGEPYPVESYTAFPQRWRS